MTMQVVAAVAEFERDLLIGRTQAGLARAKADGKPLDHPSALTDAQRYNIVRRLAEGGCPPLLVNSTPAGRPSCVPAPRTSDPRS